MTARTAGPAGAAVAAAADALRRAETVWLGTHVDPDGDAIGSLLGLAHVLTGLGKRVVAACQDPPPRDARWLPGAAAIVAHGPAAAAPGRFDLAVALDAADERRLGTLYDAASWAAQPTLVIDHHVSNPGFGDVDCIVPDKAATCEILVDVAAALGASVSAEAATCLLCGLVTDTIGFRTPSTTAGTLAAAGRLMDAGAELAAVMHHAFLSRPLVTLQLEGRALSRMTVDGPFALSWLTLADFDELGAAPEDGRGIVHALAAAAEPTAVALLRERHDHSFDVSLRTSRPVDLVPAAAALGGGGHARAAGGRTAGPLESAVQAVRTALRDHVAPGSA